MDNLDQAITSVMGADPESTVTPNKPDELDRAIDSVVFASENQQRINLLRASQSNPDVFAKAKRLAAATGLPADVVERNLSDVEKRQKLISQTVALKDATRLAEKVTVNPEFAKLAQDDLESLAAIETSVRLIKNSGKALAAGFTSANAGLWGVAEAGSETLSKYVTGPLTHDLPILPEDIFGKMAQSFRQYRKEQQSVTDYVAPKAGGVMEAGFYSGLQSLTQNLLTLPAAVMTQNPSLALGTMTGISGGQSYGQARDKGLDVNRALGYATAQAAVEFATEKLPMAKLIGDLKVGSPLYKMIGNQLAAEIPGEQLATVVQDLNEWAVLNPDKPFASYLQERPSAAAQTLVATMVGVGGNVTIAKTADAVASRLGLKERQVQQAQLDAETITQLHTVAANSKLRQRDVEAFEQFVQELAEEGDVNDIYVNASTLNQAGIDLSQLAQASPSTAAQLQEAVATGGNVRISVEEFAAKIAGTDLGQAIIPHLKTDPDGMSKLEAEQYINEQGPELQAEVERIMMQQEQAETRDQSRQVVEEQILSQLANVNRFRPDVNKAYASMMANFYAVTAEKLGVTTQEMAQRYPLQISEKSVGGTSTFNQSAIESPEFAAWFGGSQVRGDDGKPRVVYHGTGANFDAFDNDKIGSNYRRKDFFHYFAASPEVAGEQANFAARGGALKAAFRGAGANIMPAYIKLENPLVVRNDGSAPGLDSAMDYADMNREELYEQAIANGHDGIAVYDVNGENPVFGVLDPKQVKSATGNKGTFDPNDENILNQDERGAITFTGDITQNASVITLLENADLSTFLHESGHFFLEVLNDLSKRDDAPVQVKQDMETLMQWFGVESVEAWNGMTLEQRREHHETFARGFEAYLFEGNAPSVELKGLFQRFRSWMLRVYQSLRSLNIELTDEVRGVFDRMLATEEQIREARIARGMEALFKSKPDFMADDEWAKYQARVDEDMLEAISDLERRSLKNMQWMANAKSKRLKEMQRDNAVTRNKVREEVAAKVAAEPVNVAREFITRGLLPEADRNNKQRRTLENMSMGSTKLSLSVLREMYGDGPAALWRYLPVGKSGIAATDGIHPDEIADIFGFNSGDELVRALLGEPKAKDKIEALTDQLMMDRYGDLNSPESLQRAVDEAIHNEVRAKSVASEMKALQKAIGQRPILARAAKEFAQKLIDRQKVKDIRPKQYAAAAARAGRKAEKALEKGDLNTSATEKRNQLIQGYATTAAYDAQADIQKTLARFKKMAGGKDDQRSKTHDMDMVNAVRAILSAYGIGTRGQKAIDYLETVAKNDPAIHAVIQPTVDKALAGAKEWSELTVEELRGLRDEMDGLWHLARRSRQLEIDGNLMDIEDAENALYDRLEEIGIPDTVPGEGRAFTETDERLSIYQSFKASLRRVESWVGLKDGSNPMGPFRTFIWNPVKDAADAYRADKAVYLRRYRELLDTIAPTLIKAKIAAPELGYTFGYDKGGMGKVELLHAILHAGNESNKRKLLLGRQWAVENEDGSLDTTRWDSFIARMIREGKLTKADFDFAQGVWDLLEDIKPLAQKAHRDVYGRYFDEVSANAFDTPFGRYRGGYVPAMADSRIVSDAKLRGLMEEENANMVFAFPATSKGFTKGRTEYNRPLLLDLRSLSQHIDKVLLFSHLEQPIRDVRKVLARDKVATALNRIDPSAFDGLLTPWLNRTSRQQVETTVPGAPGPMRFFSIARRNAGMAAMFGNVSNTLQQITGLSIAAVKVKPRYLLSAVTDYIHSPRQMAETVVAASPYMKSRMENEVAQMNDAINDILLNPNTFDKVKSWTQRHAYFMQSAFDNVIGPIVWMGAYNQALETGPAGMTEQELQTYARRLADSAVRETQGSTLPEDISRFETGNSFVRLFNQFAGYFNMQANLLGTEFAKLSQDMGLRKGAGRGLYVLALGFLAPAWIAEAIAQAFRGGPEDEDDDGYLDDWLASVFGWGTVRSTTALIPGVGQTANAAVNAWNGKPYDDRISTSPAISQIESAIKSPYSVYKAIADDGSSARAVRDVATLISMTVGVPVNIAAKPIAYGVGVAEGKIEPTGPIDATRGVITGSASPESKQ